MKDVDFFCFGPVPTEEDCVQVSKNGEYLDEMKTGDDLSNKMLILAKAKD